jgi:hypothetical protein
VEGIDWPHRVLGVIGPVLHPTGGSSTYGGRFSRSTAVVFFT